MPAQIPAMIPFFVFLTMQVFMSLGKNSEFTCHVSLFRAFCLSVSLTAAGCVILLTRKEHLMDLDMLAEQIDTYGVWFPEVKRFKRRWEHIPGFNEEAAWLIMYKDIIEGNGSTEFFLSLGIDPRKC